VRFFSRNLIVVIGAALFVGLLLGYDPVPGKPVVGRTLAVAVLMAFYWLTDALPMAATALIPVVAFPLMGVLNASEVAPLYINNILFLFIGGFLLATGMERWDLHRRIALRIIISAGNSPALLLFGFMFGSWVLSGWVSNTATTLMMTPIVMALAVKFEEKGGEAAMSLTIALLLGIAYASSVGGMATLIGTAPNLSFARIFSQTFPDAPEITFVKWMAFALPTSALLFAVIYLYLRRVVLGRRKFDIDAHILRDEYVALGRPSFEEKTVFWVFIAFIVLIVTRADIDIGSVAIRGWASRLGVGEYVADGTVSIAIAMVLYFIPAREKTGTILDGDAINRLPWDIIILLGGGFALARAFQTSGLSEFFGQQLVVLQHVHPVLLLLAICTLITFLTELTSNTATTQVMLPIIAAMSTALGLNPLFLMIPVTITASCAFMLPVATPPNAIVFGTHRLRIADMARTGVALNFIGIVIVVLMMYTLGRAVYGIDPATLPGWAG